jgi:branched-chain amino acid transport system permease protein
LDLSIALILIQDGVTNAAIYALLALALVLVFTVTRVIFVPVGEFVSFGALTLAAFEAGRVPGTVSLLVVLGIAGAIGRLWTERQNLSGRMLLTIAVETIAIPLLIAALVTWIAPFKPPQIVQVLLALLVVAPMGIYLYESVFRPIAEASVLVLLIVSVALHLTLVGLALIFFGAEGSRTTALSAASYNLGSLFITGQSIAVLA